jgi:X-X-X-Leu-X-X-Gly heptad repeat protein
MFTICWVEGTLQLAEGDTQLADGDTQLAEGDTQLADGVPQLADRALPLADITLQLANGQTKQWTPHLIKKKLPRAFPGECKTTYFNTLKYLASGCANTIAETDASGSIMQPSVN